jgi:8-oxo-dGTP diphosphatase
MMPFAYKPMSKTASHPPHDEQAFLDGYDPALFERPSVAIDVVLLAPAQGSLHTLLIQRQEHPFRLKWALPGGFIRMNEGLEAAAARVLREKTGLKGIFLEQLYTFGAPKRDPRMRILSVAHMALVDHERFSLSKAESAAARLVVPWEGEEGGPVEVFDEHDQPMSLAFDHAEILGLTVKRLRGKLDYTPVAFQLLPEAFTLYDLQKVHETVLARKLNKDSFRKRMLATGLLEPTGGQQEDVGHRPAALYRYTA